MWKPKVSIVMGTFNGERFLKEQLDSILAQTYPIYELLIFDDASTDLTVTIVEQYCRRFSFIKLYKNPTNVGFNKNFENALNNANGEVIAIADQDDYWHPQKIERMMAHWDLSRPIIHCDSQRFTAKMVADKTAKRLTRRFEGSDSKKLFLYNSVNGHATLLKKSFLPLVLPFEKDIYYDWWIAFVASCNGGVDYLNETLVFQRVHDDNASIDKTINEKESFLKYRKLVAKHAKKFTSAPNVSASTKAFGERLYQYLNSVDKKEEQLSFFFFLITYRDIVFYYKKRTMSLFSHLKYAFRWAFY